MVGSMAPAETQALLTNTTTDQGFLTRIQRLQGSDILENPDDRLTPIFNQSQTYLQLARKRLEDSPVDLTQDRIQRLRQMIESIRSDLHQLADRRRRVLNSLDQHISQDKLWHSVSEETLIQLKHCLQSFTSSTPSTPLLVPFTSPHSPPLSSPPKTSVPCLPCKVVGRAFEDATVLADSEKEEDEQEDEGYGSLAGTPKTSSSRCLVYGED